MDVDSTVISVLNFQIMTIIPVVYTGTSPWLRAALSLRLEAGGGGIA